MTLAVPPGIPSQASWRVYLRGRYRRSRCSDVIATEINAASSVDASNLITLGGIGMDVSVDKWKDERLATQFVYEQLGNTTYTFSDITYVFDPQTPTSATNKLYAAIGTGAINKYLVIRFGMSADTALAVAQKVWVVPVSFSPAVVLPPEVNTMTRAKQAVSVTNTIQRDVRYRHLILSGWGAAVPGSAALPSLLPRPAGLKGNRFNEQNQGRQAQRHYRTRPCNLQL